MRSVCHGQDKATGRKSVEQKSTRCPRGRRREVKTEYIFPTVLIAIEFVAAAVSYAVRDDLSVAIYWLAAATLTASVTFI